MHIDKSSRRSAAHLEDLTSQARSLVKQALSNHDDKYGFGSMSCAAYDTAWVSLVSKESDGHERWLFEECFDYLLQTQSSDGGWTTRSGAHIDGILNTAGALLSISRHAARPLQLRHDAQDLRSRIAQATAFLARQLNVWDVSSTDHVGFEIIVPAILDLLENESPPIRFEFPSRKQLMDVNGAKMSRFRPEYLYGSRRMTALHSLESFIGKIDFDRVAHHKVNGSMLGSPSSTAAYLIHASQWDSEAEDYLRHVVRFAAGQGNGGVPSAFPSTHFEATWVLSTLLRAGFSPIDLQSEELVKMIDILSSAFEKENGVLGFAPYFEPDVDDTGKTITSLNMLGYPASAARMVQVFEADNHFRTYAGERDPSFTANCNALLALLHQPDVAKYALQIRKITTFLCDYWYKSDEQIKDKWNTCYLYPSVLFVEAMVDLLNLTDRGTLESVLDDELESKAALSLYQASLRPLLDQAENGSWNDSVEETAYGLLILCEARRIAFFDDLQVPLQDGIARASSFLLSTEDDPSYIWIEKVSYASPLLTGAYRLAALNMSRSPAASVVGSKFWKLARPRSGMEVHVDLFHKAPLFNSLPRWELSASMIEAALLLPSLRARRHHIFPRMGLESDENYFDVVPFFWTSSNNRDRVYASTQLIDDMTTIAMLNFQLDEFMEATAGPAFLGRMDVLRRLICDLLPSDPTKCDSGGVPLSLQTGTNGLHSTKPRGVHDDKYKKVENHISQFLSHILRHPSIARASAWDKKLLRWELKTYLLAHVQQAEDGTRFEQRKLHGKDTSSVSTTTFFQWVRTTSADHISCPYSFHLVSCMLGASLTSGGGGQDCFPSAGEKYLAKDLCTHLATMCRMYNDLGSTVRDLDEGNLNSIEFPEFESHKSLNAKMSELLMLGEYERSCMFEAFTQLRNHGIMNAQMDNDAEAKRLAERRFRIWNMFCDEVDLYGQVYVVRDISARLENQSKP